jgi:hypothetical protein
MKFWLPVGFLLLIGVIFSEEAKDARMMNRQQTDEWKGGLIFSRLILVLTFSISFIE